VTSPIVNKTKLKKSSRIIASWYKMGQDKGYTSPGVGMPIDITEPHVQVNAKDPASKPILLDGAIEGHVLVKNVMRALPLKSPKLLSVFGYDAKAPDQNDVGLAWEFGFESTDVLVATSVSQIASGGTLVSGGGSGSNSPAYINAPFDAIQQRAYDDDSTILWDFINVNSTAAVDGASDACLVFINAFASEGFDRVGLHDDFSDALVNNVCSPSYRFKLSMLTII
jgi:beta-glucosidase